MAEDEGNGTKKIAAYASLISVSVLLLVGVVGIYVRLVQVESTATRLEGDIRSNNTSAAQNERALEVLAPQVRELATQRARVDELLVKVARLEERLERASKRPGPGD